VTTGSGPTHRGGDDGLQGLVTVPVSYGDVWFDPAVVLLWNPAGSFAPVVPDASVHLIPQSAWYAFGLLERDRPGDRERALAVIDAVLATQYDRPGTPWHGTFARVFEQPEPAPGAREWVDYDPNWRQFVGTTLLMVLRHHAEALGEPRRARVEASLSLAVGGEPPGRIRPAYSNIALLQSVLCVEAGTMLGDPAMVDAGLGLAAAVVARFDRSGTFDEFNSPTYYGIDLLALAMWRTTGASTQMQDWGRRLEAALWEDMAMFFHAGLGNLVGPFVRTYGMDMHHYLGAAGLWWWAAFGRPLAPLPPLDTVAIRHGHDLFMGPLVARLGARIPAHLAEFLVGFDGVRQVERPIGEAGGPVATAWLEPDLAMGAMGGPDGGWPAPAGGQYAPATIHWGVPVPPGDNPVPPGDGPVPPGDGPVPPGDGPVPPGDNPVPPGEAATTVVGTIRLSCDDPVDARATDGVLRVTSTPSTPPPRDSGEQANIDTATDDTPGGPGNDAPQGPADLVAVISAGGGVPLAVSMVEPGRWNLPGLGLRVQTESVLANVELVDGDLVATYRAARGGHRLVVRRVVDP